jgi:hypothetical protein
MMVTFYHDLTDHIKSIGYVFNPSLHPVKNNGHLMYSV